MKFESLRPWILATVIAFLVVGPCDLSAQEAATALSSSQQSAAKSVLCSAIASKFPNPAAAGPSALERPRCALDRRLVVRGQHAPSAPQCYGHDKGVCDAARTDILGSCATGTGTSGVNPANTWCKRSTIYSETSLVILKWSEIYVETISHSRWGRIGQTQCTRRLPAGFAVLRGRRARRHNPAAGV